MTNDAPISQGVTTPSATHSGETAHTPTAEVEQFNQHVPVGTGVLFWPGAREGVGRVGATRSAAWALGGHTPVVLVEGYAGGIALTHVTPFPTAEPEPRVDLLATDRLLIEGGNPDLAEALREANCTCGHGPEESWIHENGCPYWDGTWPETPCGGGDDE